VAPAPAHARLLVLETSSAARRALVLDHVVGQDILNEPGHSLRSAFMKDDVGHDNRRAWLSR
jgi:hypothetical protein